MVLAVAVTDDGDNVDDGDGFVVDEMGADSVAGPKESSSEWDYQVWVMMAWVDYVVVVVVALLCVAS